MGGKASTPQAPDYTKLLPAQTAANTGAFNTTLNATRTNTVGPEGSQTWSKTANAGTGQDKYYNKDTGQETTADDPNALHIQTPDTETWTNTTMLSPEQQAIYDQNNRIKQNTGDATEQMLGSVLDTYSKPANFANKMPEFQNRSGGLTPISALIAQYLPQFKASREGVADPTYKGPTSISGGVTMPKGTLGGLESFMPGYNGPSASSVGQFMQRAGQFTGQDPSAVKDYQGPGMGEVPTWQGPQYDATTRNRAESAFYDREASLMDPQLKEQERAKMEELKAQGFNVNDAGASRSMADLIQRNNNTRQNLARDAVIYGGDEATAEQNRALAAENARFGAGIQSTGLRRDLASTAFDKWLAAVGARQGLQESVFDRGLAGMKANLDAYGMGLTGTRLAGDLVKQEFDAGQTNYGNRKTLADSRFSQDNALAEFQRGLGKDDAALAETLYGNDERLANSKIASNAADNATSQASYDAAMKNANFNVSEQERMRDASKEDTALAVSEDQRQQQWIKDLIAQLQLDRARPLSEFSALRTGQQVTNPTGATTAGAPTMPAADIMGATKDTYEGSLAAANAQNASWDNFMKGLFSLGGSALSAGGSKPWWM